MRVGIAVCALATLVASAGAVGAHAAELAKGDRIVFLGDSITQQGAGKGGYVTLVREAIQKAHPDLGVEVIGAGISGNKVPDLEKRLERDVLSKKPTKVVIYIGINDVWHSIRNNGTPKERFEEGLKGIIKQINDAGAQVILCTPSVIGEKTDGSNQLDKMLDEYSEISRKVAKETKAQLLDLHKDFESYLKEHNAANAGSKILTTDGVHLNAAGNQFVAETMLTALGAKAPEPVKAGDKAEKGQKGDKADKAGKADKAKKGPLRHVVLFGFKPDATPEQVHEVEKAFAELPKKIDAIAGFEFGTDVSTEMRAQGYTHCFLVTFKDAAGRDAYLPHPAHQEFVKLALPRIEKVLVVDYYVQK